MNNQDLINEGKQYVMNTYSRFPIALTKGKGIKAWDADGNEYLDFVEGIAVNNLGHCHPNVVDAIKKQSAEFMHCSNLYWIEPQVRLAKILVENSALDKVFFCNSGAEANEAAIKLARKYGRKKLGENCSCIITMNKSFHGRTLATMSATGQEKIRKGYDPLPKGFKYSPFNDIEALKESVTDEVCAVMLEPVQGEGGINVASQEFLQYVNKICKEKKLLLIFDEVQCGMGRTGSLFAYENFGIEPDIMTLAKALGGGTAVGAMLAKDHAAENFMPGDHASTFGGNALACAASEAVITTILQENILKNCKDMGDYLTAELKNIAEDCEIIKEVRGKGLLVGIELNEEALPVVKECMKNGLLVLTAGSNVLRLLPPLNVTKKDIDNALEILSKVLK